MQLFFFSRSSPDCARTDVAAQTDRSPSSTALVFIDDLAGDGCIDDSELPDGGCSRIERQAEDDASCASTASALASAGRQRVPLHRKAVTPCAGRVPLRNGSGTSSAASGTIASS